MMAKNKTKQNRKTQKMPKMWFNENLASVHRYLHIDLLYACLTLDKTQIVK